MSFFVNGIGVSKGYGIGPAYILQRNPVEVFESVIDESLVTEEIQIFTHALGKTISDLNKIKDNLSKNKHFELAAFLDSHLKMLDDPSIKEAPVEIIKSKKFSSLWALETQKEKLVQVFKNMDDPYLSARQEDVIQVIQKIQQNIMQQPEEADAIKYSNLKGAIIIADDLTPADTVDLQNQGIAGFITESGGPLSHTAILSRSLGIPAIVGLHHARAIINNGETIILDGFKGNILLNPDKHSLKHYKKRFKEYQLERKLLETIAHKPSVTLDNKQITLQANIETPDDLKAVKKLNTDGVGLYRTEFLYMHRDDLPDEEEHYKAYLKIIRSLKGAPLTIRTVDLGADKEFNPAAHSSPLVHNPALGLRGIRLALSNPNIFIPQLKAIIRASAKGPVKILLPMITTLGEAQQSLQIIEELKSTLKSRGYKYASHIPVGAMIEVPSSAILAEQFAQHLDFLSIGTNDLVQYTLAIDRLDDEVNYLYNPIDPAVLYLIQMVINAGKKYKKEVSMCGEMAGETRFTRLLLGMGLRNFSVQPNSLLEIKEIIRNSRVSQLIHQVDDFFYTDHPALQEPLLEKINQLH